MIISIINSTRKINLGIFATLASCLFCILINFTIYYWNDLAAKCPIGDIQIEKIPFVSSL